MEFSAVEKQKDLLHKISDLTLQIKEHHPEIYQFVEEVPDTIGSKDYEMNVGKLERYYDTLKKTLERHLQAKTQA